MKIEQVDFFYYAMPEVTTEADGSQDVLLVRAAGGGHVGYGECEAAPLPTIAAFVCPMSHGVCRPVGASVLGERLDGPDDIRRMAQAVAYDSMDLLQAAHCWSGVEMALWDLLGKARQAPAWSLLGHARSLPRTPYASQLFGDTPQQTLDFGRAQRAAGFRAVKFGWGPIGRFGEAVDRDHFVAAREGIGEDGVLLVDVGQIYGEDVEAAARRLPALEQARAHWLEEPFHGHSYESYGALAGRSRVRLAGGEAAHNVFMAKHLIDYGKIGFVQIDCGRIGGLGPARAVADHARARGVTYVNHTFTSHLALSASLQPYAGFEECEICEYPVKPKPVATAFCGTPLAPGAEGAVRAPERPGLGVDVDLAAARPYLLDIEIRVGGRRLYATPVD
ncbi:MAG: mandelate racemase/muconate lactonizing enzyme family protein [Methylobacteriaceae bacterium]|nr:mandelate racemase/muconate lactonizing enzyme family protein [Methylobacteriaceae bacterium]